MNRITIFILAENTSSIDYVIYLFKTINKSILNYSGSIINEH